MARKQVTNEYPVDEGQVAVTLTALGGIEGAELGIRLGGMLGPAVITLFTAMDTKSAEAGAQAGKMIFEKLTPAVFKEILKQLIQGGQINIGGEFRDLTVKELDDAFSGNVVCVYRIFFDAVRLNFRNFTQGLGISSGTLAKLEAIAKKAMEKAGVPQASA